MTKYSTVYTEIISASYQLLPRGYSHSEVYQETERRGGKQSKVVGVLNLCHNKEHDTEFRYKDKEML